jgi:hypothetical protein
LKVMLDKNLVRAPLESALRGEPEVAVAER